MEYFSLQLIMLVTVLCSYSCVRWWYLRLHGLNVPLANRVRIAVHAGVATAMLAGVVISGFIGWLFGPEVLAPLATL